MLRRAVPSPQAASRETPRTRAAKNGAKGGTRVAAGRKGPPLAPPSARQQFDILANLGPKLDLSTLLVRNAV